MKQGLLILLSIAGIRLCGQTRNYTPEVIYDTLFSNVHRMECKLFNAAIHGKIKAYKSDSLTSFFNPGELKKFVEMPVQNNVHGNGNYTPALDSMSMVDFNPAKDGKGLCGYYKAKSVLENPEQEFTLIAVALMYEPFAGFTDYRLPVQPMFYIQRGELRKVLTYKEQNLLYQLLAINLSDKVNNGTSALDSVNVKVSKVLYFSPGVNTDFKKFSFLNSESLKYLSKSIYYISVQYIHDEALRQYRGMRDNNLEVNTPLYDSLLKALSHPVHLTIYEEKDEVALEKDTVIIALVSLEDFTNIQITDTHIGIVRDNSEHSAIWFTKKEFETFSPQWLPRFLFGLLK